MGGKGVSKGVRARYFWRFLISAWRTLQTPCLYFSHKPLHCSMLCPLHPAWLRYDSCKALLHKSELLGTHQWPWVRKSRGQEEKSLTCLLLTGRALQHQRGSENLTPFLRVIDNNFLERLFIPGLQTSFEYLWRISSIVSLMGSGHKGKKT